MDYHERSLRIRFLRVAECQERLKDINKDASASEEDLNMFADETKKADKIIWKAMDDLTEDQLDEMRDSFNKHMSGACDDCGEFSCPSYEGSEEE